MDYLASAKWAVHASLVVGSAALALALLTARHCAALAACAF